MDLSNKEIANRLGVEPKSIRMAPYRIKQKLELARERPRPVHPLSGIVLVYLLISKYICLPNQSYMADTTREKIVELADQLIRTKGFNAFSYADISAPLAIRNAAIHYHFPSKADLGISVIDHEMEQFAAQKCKWEQLPEDEQLKKLFGVFRQRSKQGTICLVGSLTPDYDTLPASMQQKVREMCATLLSWVAQCLEKGRAHRRFDFEGSAEDRALLVMSNLLSSLLFSRVLGGNIFGRMSDRLAKDLRDG